MIVAELDPASERTVVAVRRAARHIARALGHSTQDQTRLAAAASEVAREAREQAAGPLRFEINDTALCITVEGLRLTEGGVGRLVDAVHEKEGTVILEKRMPNGEAPDDECLRQIKMDLLTADPRAAGEEIRRQNAELLQALSEQQAAEEALRRSEGRLRQALAATHLGTFEVTDRWRCSARCAAIFGIEPGANPLSGLDAERRAILEEAVAEVRRTGEPLELELELRAGVWVALRGILESGDVVGTALDVSERRQREEETRLRAELEELLVGVVSHDLRSPLNTIQMSLGLLAQESLSKEDRDFVLKRIHSAVGTADELVHALLDFTKARLGGGIPIAPDTHDGHALVREALEDLRVAYPEGRLEHQQAGEGRVRVDAERFKQVLTNLVGNGLQHASEGTPVRVSSEGSPDAFHLRVQNQGEPISPEMLATIFQPLQQTDDGLRKSRKGSLGLGLFIVKHVVEAHGGAVSVTSSEDEGTVFSVSIPVDGPPICE